MGFTMTHNPASTLTPLFKKAINDGVFPGAAIAVITNTPKITNTFLGFYGHTDYQKTYLVSLATVYDLASLTKPLATTLAIFSLIKDNRLSLTETLPTLLGCSLPEEKREITLLQLLNHSAGLAPHQPFYLQMMQLPEEQRLSYLQDTIIENPLSYQPGEKQVYSDLGFMLLGMIVEHKAGLSLAEYTRQRIFSPVALQDHLFFSSDVSNIRNDSCCSVDLAQETPPPLTGGGRGVGERTTDRTLANIPPTLTLPHKGRGDGHRQKLPQQPSQHTQLKTDTVYAPTENCPWRQRMLCGEVHDDNASAMGGVAGHAGLFGTIQGVAGMVGFLLDLVQGRQHHPFLNHQDLQRAVRQQNDVGSWGIGFDTRSESGSSSGRYLSPSSFGHLGYTGTSFWVDPERDLAIVLLTNRVHPSRDNDKIRAFRPLFHDAVMEWVVARG